MKDNKGNLVEIDQDAVDAALAGAVTMVDGSHPPARIAEERPVADEQSGEKKGKKTSKPIATSEDEFAKDCLNLNIDAKKCHYQSSKHSDESINDALREINKKIYNETQKGGYSTNIQYKVIPSDWINISHIIDWYRTRGFLVDVKETTTSPYGKDVGTMIYNFTISWAVA